MKYTRKIVQITDELMVEMNGPRADLYRRDETGRWSPCGSDCVWDDWEVPHNNDDEVRFRVSLWLSDSEKPFAPNSPCEYGRSTGSIRRDTLQAPSFSGAGHQEERLEWVAKNLPLGFNESYDWQGEAAIAWNVAGGAPGQYYNDELARAVECYAKGRKYETPLGDWNDHQKKKRKARIDAGIDDLTPALEALGINEKQERWESEK